MELSWPAIQDDALIHLRYANNLYLHHFVTYDGVHPDYGASSLLYVGLLALLRGMASSANLPRAVSSVVHGLLFGGSAFAFARYLPRRARVARLAAGILLVLLVVPSAVRWLDDGMETGLAVSVATLLAWLLHGRPGRDQAAGNTAGRFALLVLISCLAVLLRPELLLLCAAGFLLLALRAQRGSGGMWAGTPTVLGAALAMALVLSAMHAPLPDTAVAKSLGIRHWFDPLHDTAITLGGAFSFGVGALLFWVLTLTQVIARRGRMGVQTALANCFFPVVLTLSALRGQEIQGVRYFAWTFFFSITWNVLDLAEQELSDQNLADRRLAPRSTWQSRRQSAALYVFALILCAVLPFETVAMKHVLTQRAETVRGFETHPLNVLRDRQGMASDVGYIGYFSGAKICDLAGLVNGRVAARMSKLERAQACVAMDPDFVFLNRSQLMPMAQIIDLSQWRICGWYDFANVRTPDRHYLIVRLGIVDGVCRATGFSPTPIGSIR